MRNRFRLQFVAAFLTLFCVQSLAATPRVVVSLPPIHSLVSALMQGVGEPILLFQQEIDSTNEMDPFQKSQLLTADLVIWVGAGLESSMTGMLQQFPAVKDRFTTLSHTVPLLPRKGFNGIQSSRQISRDLHFWSDPRIAMMAVKQLTPLLVRIDPDHAARYLDNEILLLKRIKKTEREILAMLAPLDPIPEQFAAEFDPYFSHRFVRTVSHSSESGIGLQKVSTYPTATCRGVGKAQQRIDPGPEHYFQIMHAKARHIHTCAKQLRNITITSENPDNRRQES
ncbi:MAG: zinc ABC transporter substrate-binding protein [Candidatus Thiodiazotropha sp. (ex Codakia rugifera)]|nr:zinc ABC transporter substrate-binding protein [Candidatus Thiodiazotropha sp. (ex Codakia rugifera)]